MEIGYDAELETRIILKLLTKAGFEIRKVMSTGNYNSDEVAYGKPEEEGLWWNEWVVGKSEDEITKIANNFDDCLLIVRRDGRDGWLRFVYGNSWGELICDHSGGLTLPHHNLFDWGYGQDKESLLGLHYDSWDIGEVFELFGLRKNMTLMELIERYKEMIK
tara:strand:+ start:633 stop:1118 length:486 start_codon:yes stop_codon:yes gene_type:complete